MATSKDVNIWAEASELHNRISTSMKDLIIKSFVDKDEFAEITLSKEGTTKEVVYALRTLVRDDLEYLSLTDYTEEETNEGIIIKVKLK